MNECIHVFMIFLEQKLHESFLEAKPNPGVCIKKKCSRSCVVVLDLVEIFPLRLLVI